MPGWPGQRPGPPPDGYEVQPGNSIRKILASAIIRPLHLQIPGGARPWPAAGILVDGRRFHGVLYL